MDLTDAQNKLEKEINDLNNIIYTQIEREKKMATAGSIDQKSQVAISKLDAINTLVNEYNKKGAEILVRKESGEFKNYTPEYVSQLVEQEKQNHLKNYLPKVEEFLKDVLGWLSLSLQQKEEVRFPYRNSKDVNKAQLGEMKSVRAQSFVNAAKEDSNLIANELFTALRSNDDDYFNSLVNFILMNEPRNEIDKSDLLRDKPHQVKLFETVRNVYKEFAGKNNLQLLDVAIITLTTVATEANSFLAAIKGGEIFYLPKRMAEKMDQNEVARNVEMVNSSVPYWGTKLESLDYVFQIV